MLSHSAVVALDVRLNLPHRLGLELAIPQHVVLELKVNPRHTHLKRSQELGFSVEQTWKSSQPFVYPPQTGQTQQPDFHVVNTFADPLCMVVSPGQLELEVRNFSSETDHNQLQELSVVALLEISIDQWPSLHSVVNSNRWLMFEILGLQKEKKPDWLQVPSSMWYLFADYKKLEEFSFNLSVTNNIAERGVRIITDFLNKTKDKNWRQALLQTVEYFR